MEKIEDWIKKTTAKEDERFNKVKIAHTHTKKKKWEKEKKEMLMMLCGAL